MDRTGIACVYGDAGLEAAERIRNQKKSWLPRVRVSVPSSPMPGNAWPPKTSRRPLPAKLRHAQRRRHGVLGEVEGAQDGLGVRAGSVAFGELAQIGQDDVVVSLHVLESAESEGGVVLADAQDLPGPAQQGTRWAASASTFAML